jgi:hypothetical protein
MLRWLDCITRIAILLIGGYCGVLLFLSIGIIFMEDDSSHPMTPTMAMIGWIGSILLLIGGIVGAYVKRWIILLPGTILVLVALASSILPYLWAAVAISMLLLIHCLMPVRSGCQANLPANLTDVIDSCFDTYGNKT